MIKAPRPLANETNVATLFAQLTYMQKFFDAGRFARAYDYLPVWLEDRIVAQCALPRRELDGVWTQSVTYAFGHAVTFIAPTPAEVHAKMCKETVDHVLRAIRGFQEADIDLELLLLTN